MNSNTFNFDFEALANLEKISSSQILLGATPITQISAPMKVAKIIGAEVALHCQYPISIKRDDLTPGFGNKTRKLEVILADAIACGADSIITAGGPQSNHCRQTAQFGRQAGLDVHLIFGTSTGEKDFPYIGNQVVDRLFGAEVHVCVKKQRPEAMVALSDKLTLQGKTPYVIAVGGSNYLGALAYAKGFQEFLKQCEETQTNYDRIVFATSSGGTQAGLVVGAKLSGWTGEILGISIDQLPDVDEPNPKDKYVKHMVDISNRALEVIGSTLRLSPSDFKVNYNYLQDGYGVVGDYDRLGVKTLANHGIISGPVYSGRAFGALIDLMSKKIIPDDGKTLFWHTGGAGEIDVYKNDLF